MTYSALVSMAQSASLRDRATAAAAEQGVSQPMQWASENLWRIAASPGWADQWSYATDELTVNQNPDLGVRTDVISDADILAAVQTLLAPPP